MHELLVNRLGGVSLPRKSVVRFTDRPHMTLDVYCGRKTPTQQQQLNQSSPYDSEYRFQLRRHKIRIVVQLCASYMTETQRKSFSIQSYLVNRKY